MAVTLTILAAVGCYVVAAWLWPALMTPVFWAVTHLGYRFRVRGREFVPSDGPALIVCNHVTYLDWLFLWVGTPRPLTYVIWSGFDSNGLMKLGLSFARRRLIQIDNARGRPHATAAALDRIAAALDEGRAVVVFAEGTLTRNGHMLPFGRGIEHVLRRVKSPVNVIPAYLGNLWGTLFSWSDGRIFWKRPAGGLRRRVTLQFGRPLPASTTAAEVRQAVQECSAERSIADSDSVTPVTRAFVRMAGGWRNVLRPACVDVATGTERRMSWGQTLVASWSLATRLRARLADETIVGVWLPTGLGGTLANAALGFLGKTTVNLNYTAGPDAVGSAVRRTGLRFVVTAKRFELKVPPDLPDGVERLYLEDLFASIPGWEKAVRFAAVLAAPAWLLVRLIGLPATAPDAPLTIIFSSGTTGDPKGVVLSHRNIASNVDGFVSGIGIHRSDRMLATLPFFHSFGYTVCLWAPLTVGMEAVYYPDPRQAKELGELCRKHACTIMLGTATFLRFYLRRSGPDDFRGLRLLVCGAEKLPVKLADEFSHRFGVWPLEGYGCTELSPVVSVNLPDATAGGVTQKANVLGTIGQALPGQVIRTFDADTRVELPPGAEGILGVKGPNVMWGYYQEPGKTRAVIQDGYYLTGDVGRVEPTGFVRITGRTSRFAKIAGEMVPLERLDEELHDILGRQDDRVLVVAAIPCERRGERLVVLHNADVRPELSSAFEQLRSRGLPNLWVPDLRNCFPVESFPVLGSGKLDLKRVGELAAEIAVPVGSRVG